MKKKIYLYGAIALVLIAAAIFFAVYSTNGKTYDYVKNAPRRVTAADYTQIDISGVKTPTAATADDVLHKIAELLKTKASSTMSTTIIPDEYDVVAVVYFATDEAGKVLTDPDTMNPAKITKVQLNSSDALLAAFGGALTQKPRSYNTVLSGLADRSDLFFVTYTPAGEDAKQVKSEMMSGEDFVTRFGENSLKTPIGEEITDIAGFSTVKVDWVARKAYNSQHTHAAGEYMFITVTTTNTSDETLTWYLRTDGTTDNTEVVNKNGTKEGLDSEIIAALLKKTLKTGNAGSMEFIGYKGSEIKASPTLSAQDFYTDTACKNLVEDKTTMVDDTTYYKKVDKHSYAVTSVMPRPAAEDGFTYVTLTSGSSVWYLKTDGTAANTEVVGKNDSAKDLEDKILTALIAALDGSITDGKTGSIESVAYTGAEIKADEKLKDEKFYTDAECKNAVEDNAAVEDATTYYKKVTKHSYTVTKEYDGTNIVKAADFADAVTYVYPDDSTEKDKDGNELKGKTVLFHVIPVGVYNIDVSYTNMTGLSAFAERADGTNLKSLKSAYDTYATKLTNLEAIGAVKSAEAAWTAYENARKALFKDTGLKEADTKDYVEAMNAYLRDKDNEARKTEYDAKRTEISDKMTSDDNRKKLDTCESAYSTLLEKVKPAYWGNLETAVKDEEKINGIKADTIKAYCDAAIAFFADETDDEKEVAYYDAYRTFSNIAGSDNKTKIEEYVSALQTMVTRAKSYEVITDNYTAISKTLSEDDINDLIEKIKAHAADVKNEDVKKMYDDAVEALKKKIDDADLTDDEKTARKDALVAYAEAGIKAVRAGQTDKLEAKTGMVALITAIDKDKTDWFTSTAKKELNASVANVLNEERQSDYELEAAKVIWAYLLDNSSVKVPSRAIRIAKDDITDYYKKKYYTDEKNYTQYKSFGDYLTATLKADNYRAAKNKVKDNAEQNVRQLFVIYAMAEKLGVDVTAKEAQSYAANGQSYYNYSVQMRQNAYAIDKVTEILLEKLGAPDSLYFE